jgi:hypothetical protein
MAIRGKTARACFDEFVAHLNKLVHATLPTNVPLEVAVPADRPTAGTLGFRGVYTVPLATKHGTIYLYLGQLLECVEDKKRAANERFHLSTRKYWYGIQLEQGGQVEPIFRWEYVSPKLPEYKDQGKRWCWRHLQMPHTVPMTKGKLDLKKCHLPSGYIVLEDLIRFLICDMGVKPPCGKTKWHKKLLDSEDKFIGTFNTKFRAP